MKWVEFCLKQKYIIFSIIIATIILGLVGRYNIPINLFPDTAPPMVNVITTCPGMSAQEVKNNISKPLEEEFTALDGVKETRSLSQGGLSMVEIEFQYGTDLDSAAVDTQNAITHIKDDLPTNIGEPRIQKFSTANRPIMTLSITSSELSPAVLSELTENELQDELQRVDGVAALDVFGSSPSQINVKIDRNKLEELNISMQTIQQIIEHNNVTLPGGNLDVERENFSIRIVNEALTIDELKNIVVKNQPESYITLGDVATVEESKADSTSKFRCNGQSSIALQILKKDDANTVQVVGNIENKIKELADNYPAVKISVASDDADFTQTVIGNMSSSVMEALLLAALVIILFLSSFTQSVVVVTSMPLTYLGTFAVMRAVGLDLNLITLSALILSVGFVIDQTIVVVESIVRHQQELMEDSYQAALNGTTEVILPLAAGTLTTVVVLIPLLFIEGFVGKIFGPLAATMTIALSISLFVSITIIPLLTVILGNITWTAADNVMNSLSRPISQGLDALKDFYIKSINWGLKYPKSTIFLALITLLIGIALIRMEGMVVLPQFDSGSFAITVQTDPGTSLDHTAEITEEIEKLLDKESNIVNYNTQIGYEPGSHFLGELGTMGVNQAVIDIELTSRKERNETIWEIEERIRKGIKQIPVIDTYIVKEEGATAVATTKAPINIRITGDNMEVLDKLARNIQEKVAQIPGTVNLYRNWDYNKPELVIYPREYTEHGLSTSSISQHVFQAVEGRTAAEFDKSNRDLPIIMDYTNSNIDSLSDVGSIPINTPFGYQIPLRTVADIEEKWGPSAISQTNNQTDVEILGFTHERTFSFVVDDINKELQNINVPSGYEVTIEGEQKDLQESSRDLIIALIIAVLGVYLVLLAQFRSFIHPITIMMAIPLVTIGIALALLYSAKPVSMPVMLSFILLAGTIVNNSILLVDYTNRLRAAGNSLSYSLIEAVNVRFRPIIMTATAAIAGMLPLALEWALGAERFSPLAITTIGGLITGTLLTMIIIPVIYSLFAQNNKIKGD